MDETAFEVRLKHLEEEFLRFKDGRKEIFDRIGHIETQNAVTTEQYRGIMDELGKQRKSLADIQKTLDDMSRKPLHRYEIAVRSIVSTLSGGIAGFLVNKFLGG